MKPCTQVLNSTLNVCLFLVLVQLIEFFGYTHTGGGRIFAMLPYLAAWFSVQRQRTAFESFSIASTFVVLSAIRAVSKGPGGFSPQVSLSIQLIMFGLIAILLLLRRVSRQASPPNGHNVIWVGICCLVPSVVLYVIRNVFFPGYTNVQGDDYGILFSFVNGSLLATIVIALLTARGSSPRRAINWSLSGLSLSLISGAGVVAAVLALMFAPDPELVLAALQLGLSAVLPYSWAIFSILMNSLVAGFALMHGVLPTATFTLGQDLGALYVLQSILTGQILGGYAVAYGALNVARAFKQLNASRRFFVRAVESAPQALLLVSGESKAPVLLTNVLRAKLGWNNEARSADPQDPVYKQTGLDTVYPSLGGLA